MSAESVLVLQVATEDRSNRQQLIAFRNGTVFRRSVILGGSITRWRYASTPDVVGWLNGYVSLQSLAPVPLTLDRGPVLVEANEVEVAQVLDDMRTMPASLAGRALQALGDADPDPVKDVEAFIATWAKPLGSIYVPGDAPGLFIVVEGNPVDGFVFHGIPAWADASDASEWAGDNCTREWWVAPLQDVER